MLIALLAFILAANDTAKLSEAIGHMLGKHLHELPLNMEAIAKGLSDEAEGKASPMDEETCLEQLALLNAIEQREAAEEFLRKNGEKTTVHSLLDGKLQYEIVREGTGEPVAAYHSPLVRFEGNREEVVVLQEAMPGLKAGLEGMHEGEIRRLFIHPELGGDGIGGPLCTMEVELLRADASGDAQAAYERENLPEVPPLR